MSGGYLGEVVGFFIVLVTAISASGFFAAVFARRQRLERDEVLRGLGFDEGRIDEHAVALQSLRFELEAAKVEMEKRRAVEVAQEELIRQQQQDLLDARQTLVSHEVTIIQLARWASWATRVLETKGVEAPPPPVPPTFVLPPDKPPV